MKLGVMFHTHQIRKIASQFTCSVVTNLYLYFYFIIFFNRYKNDYLASQ